MGRTKLLLPAGAGGLAASVAATPAAAHTGLPLGGFGAGAAHPVLGIDHLLAMVAVGALATVGAGRRPVWRLPAAFLAGMAVGGLAGIVGRPAVGSNMAVAGSLVALGACLAVPGAVAGRFVVPLVAVAGALHGHVHGLEIPGAAHPASYAAGFLATTAGLHVAGAAGGLGLRRPVAARALAGTFVAAVGLLLFGAG